MFLPQVYTTFKAAQSWFPDVLFLEKCLVPSFYRIQVWQAVGRTDGFLVTEFSISFWVLPHSLIHMLSVTAHDWPWRLVQIWTRERKVSEKYHLSILCWLIPQSFLFSTWITSKFGTTPSSVPHTTLSFSSEVFLYIALELWIPPLNPIPVAAVFRWLISGPPERMAFLFLFLF